MADYRRLFRRARQFGLGLTVHTGEAGPVEEVARVVELLEPDRIGHGVKAAYDPRAMTMIRERGIVLEICPTSNLNTRVVSGWDEFRWIFDTLRRNEVRFTINTDGPEMLKTYIRDELAQLGRLGILSVADQESRGRHVARRLVRAQRHRRPGAPPRAGLPRRRRARRGLTGPSVGGSLRDPVGAAAVARGDVRLADDVGAEDLGEQLELGLAGRRRARGDVEDRAVVLAQPDRPVRAEDRVGEVALVGLDDRQLAHPIEQRRVAVDAVGHLLADPVTELAPSRGEDLVEQVVAADRLDRGEEARGEGVVVRREEVLRVGRDVVQVARPADAVAHGLAGDEVGGLERAELLEHAGPARAEPPGQLVGRARTVEPQPEQQLATQAGRAAGRSSDRAPAA